MPTKQEAAELQAAIHHDVDQEMVQIYRAFGVDEVDEDPGEPIKLLEVDEGRPRVGISPHLFRAQPWKGRPFHPRIVVLTPEVFDRLDPDFRLPDGWDRLEPIERPAAALIDER